MDNEPRLENFKRLTINNGQVSISLLSCARITNGVSIETLTDALKEVTSDQWATFVNTAARYVFKLKTVQISFSIFRCRDIKPGKAWFRSNATRGRDGRRTPILDIFTKISSSDLANNFVYRLLDSKGLEIVAINTTIDGITFEQTVIIWKKGQVQFRSFPFGMSRFTTAVEPARPRSCFGNLSGFP